MARRQNAREAEIACEREALNRLPIDSLAIRFHLLPTLSNGLSGEHHSCFLVVRRYPR